MATPLNIRLDDEREEALKEILEELKENTPVGSEVNNSTIMRGALDKFKKDISEEKQGIRKISYKLNNLNEKELNYLLLNVLEDFKKYSDEICKIDDKDTQFVDEEPSETKIIELQKLLNDMLTQFKLDVLDEMTKRVRR